MGAPLSEIPSNINTILLPDNQSGLSPLKYFSFSFEMSNLFPQGQKRIQEFIWALPPPSECGKGVERSKVKGFLGHSVEHACIFYTFI